MTYLFAEFELDEQSFCLTQNGQRVPLEPKSLQVLLLLLQSDGRLLKKDAILEAVWKDTFVEETTLTRAIALLRKQLGDDPRRPTYIETVPTLGYRFIAPVEVRSRKDRTSASADAAAAEATTEVPPEALPPLVVVPEPAATVPELPSTVPQKAIPRKAYYYAAAVAVLSAAIAGAFFLHRSSPIVPSNSNEWEQLTFFTDSAVYPALSPDGRMLAFIRGNDPFIGHGQVYVKFLPGGEPVQLTHDAKPKIAPAFSPDGSRIAYSIIEPWDTYEVPVLGGDPHLLLPNSSSLSWIEGGKRLLFSELREGLHLVLVTTDASRGDSRDVYAPPGKRSMAHHSYLSPDGQWVIVVEMDSQGKILPCRVVPFHPPNPASGGVKLVGPPNRRCLAGAWSPDGKWIYLTASEDPGAVGHAGWQPVPGSHIWRQRFPDGQPEQLTFGPTSQEGIAMAPDGKSLITAVGSEDHTVWMHDNNGDHQISSEGNAGSPSFSSDGRSLYFLMAHGQTGGKELWIKDLGSGKVERVLPGYPMQDYAVSRDGKQVAFTRFDQSSPSNLWVAPTSRRTSPVHISSAVVEDSPFFLPDGDIVFRAIENGSSFLYRMKADGSARHKITQERILDIYDASPDGRWVVAGTPGTGDEEHINLGKAQAFAVDGSTAVTLCIGYCIVDWDTTGRFVYVSYPAGGESESSYALPVMSDSGLPKVSPVLPARLEDFANQKSGTAIPREVESALSPTVYAYTLENTRRNLYRIPLP